MRVVLDASALLAYVRAEPGSEAVDGVLGSALITSVNWAEVLEKSLSASVKVEGLRLELAGPWPDGGAILSRRCRQGRSALAPDAKSWLVDGRSRLPEPGVAPRAY